MFWKLKAKLLWFEKGYRVFDSNKGKLYLHESTVWISFPAVLDGEQLRYKLSWLLSVAYQWMGKEVVVE